MSTVGFSEHDVYMQKALRLSHHSSLQISKKSSVIIISVQLKANTGASQKDDTLTKIIWKLVNGLK